jgi:hypothetical protein
VLSASSLRLWCGRRRAAELSPAMARGGAAAAARCERRRKEKEGAGDRTGEMVWEPAPASRPGGLEAGRGASNAGVRPPRGRRRVERGASARGRERERGGRPGRLLGRKGSGVGPAAPAPFSFFFEFLFSKFFLNSFGPI